MDAQYKDIREKFFSYLLKRTCTKKQAEDFLLRSKIPEKEYEKLISEAEEIGLIDDLAFAKLTLKTTN